MLQDFPVYKVTHKDKTTIKKMGLGFFILNKVLSNRFRKTSPGCEVHQQVEQRINSAIESEEPINFTIPTGGYKKWHLESAPEADWAEFFHLRFMFEYFSPILAVYKPGIILDYFSNAWLIKVISHYPQEDLDAYTDSFRKLICEFEKFFPDNFKVRFNVVSDQKDERTLLERILENRPLVEKDWRSLSKAERHKRLEVSGRNIRWDILEEAGKLSPGKKERFMYEGKIIHDSLLKGGWNKDLDYLFNDGKIGIIHRSTKEDFLHLSTYYGSFVQFWVARGILTVDKNKLVPRVLSYNQYLEQKPLLKKIPVNLLGPRNFKKVELLQL